MHHPNHKFNASLKIDQSESDSIQHATDRILPEYMHRRNMRNQTMDPSTETFIEFQKQGNSYLPSHYFEQTFQHNQAGYRRSAADLTSSEDEYIILPKKKILSNLKKLPFPMPDKSNHLSPQNAKKATDFLR